MTQPLWFLRFEGRILGPYPPRQVREWLRDGSITPEWEISLDEQDWISIEASHQFRADPARAVPAAGVEALVWQKERERARKRWLADEERPESALVQDAASAERARQALEQDHDRTADLARREAGRRPSALLALAALVLLALAGYGVWLWQQPDLGRSIGKGLALSAQANCASPLTDGVNWTNCSKAELNFSGLRAQRSLLDGARLEGALLRGSDFSNATLRGANLRNADLNGAVLSGADLSGADLTGANLGQTRLEYAVLRDAKLEGARLDGAQLAHAIWVDGHACADGAVGECR